MSLHQRCASLCSASMTNRRMSLIRVRWPSRFDLNHSRTLGPSGTPTGTLGRRSRNRQPPGGAVRLVPDHAEPATAAAVPSASTSVKWEAQFESLRFPGARRRPRGQDVESRAFCSSDNSDVRQFCRRADRRAWLTLHSGFREPTRNFPCLRCKGSRRCISR